MKGAGDVPPLTFEEELELQDTIRYGPFDLSDTKIWGTRVGRESLEFTLADRLFDHRLSQQDQTTSTADAAGPSAQAISE